MNANLSRSFIAGATLVGFVVLAILAGPLIYQQEPNSQNLRETLQGPSWERPLGTDQYGRDVLARVLDGGRRSLGTAATVVALTLIAGFVIGWMAARDGMLGSLLTRVTDTALALPSTIVALSVVGALGIGMQNLIVAFVIVGWPFYARVVRGLAVERMKSLDIAAARAHGVRDRAIFTGHVAPHAIRTIGIVAALDLGYTLAALSGFSYLGLGAQAPAAEWGAMLKDAQLFFAIAPWFLVGPALGIGLTVLGTTLMAEQSHTKGIA